EIEAGGRGVHRGIVARRANRSTLGDRRGSDPGDLALLEGLDDVALLQVGEVLEADAALEALADLAHVVLEAAERRDRALPDDRPVAEEADLRAPGDRAVGDEATR